MPPELIQKLGEFQDELEKLKTATKEIKEAGKVANESAELSEKILKSFGEFIEPTSKLIDKIEKVDFPIRLDKLDVAITSINSGMNNLIQRLDTVEREIKEKIESKITETHSIINSLIEKQNSEIKALKLYNLISIILMIILLIIILVKL